MKGIILAGGLGTRLKPLTTVLSKQLLPIYDKPMIYYPLWLLLLIGVKDILIITTKEHHDLYFNLLKDGSLLGCSIKYLVQNNPNGLAEAFIIGKDFIQNDKVTLILGDTILYSHNLDKYFNNINNIAGAGIFTYHVHDPERYGVVNFDSNNSIVALEEKPKNPKSNLAIPGIYIYNNDVVEMVKEVRPSLRNELEITSLNQLYLESNKLYVKNFGDDVTWFDTGTIKSLYEASSFVESIESSQDIKIGCIEEVAWEKGYITDQQLEKIIHKHTNSQYGQYLSKLLNK